MAYNYYYELASIFFVALFYIFTKLKYTNTTKLNRRFLALTMAIMLADVVDVANAILINMGTEVPIWLTYSVSLFYFILAIMVVYLFILYVITFTGTKKKGFLIHINIVSILYAFMLIYNIFNPVIFTFDQDAVYQKGILYPLVYAVPLYMGLSVIVYLHILIIGKVAIGRNLIITSTLFVGLVAIGGIMQFFWFPDTLLTCFAASLGLMIIMLSLETPDYQALMKTMKAIDDANNAKTDFLAKMSHEIRTPINTIMGMNEMIERECQDENILGYNDHSKAATTMLLDIVNELLDISRIESGKMDVARVKYDVPAFYQEIFRMVEYRASKKSLAVLFQIDENLPKGMIGDERKLRQILLNLLTNAVKYTEKGSVSLVVSGEMKQGKEYLSFQVIDTGIGIHQADIPHLLEEFSRFEERRNVKEEGTGLGLSIASAFLKLMNSTLKIESEIEKGSTFSFEIEQLVYDSTPIGNLSFDFKKNTRTTYAPQLVGNGQRILVVDDNSMNRMVFLGLLKNVDLHIDQAESGENAIEMTKKNRYELIFMDYMMPKLNGGETMQIIREDSDNLNTKTPIIVLTANAVAGVREEYLKLGFDDYLSKPIRSVQLEKIISRYLVNDLIGEGENMDSAALKDYKPLEESVEEMPFLEDFELDYAASRLESTEKLKTCLREYYDSLDGMILLLKKYAGEENNAVWDERRMKIIYKLIPASKKCGANLIATIAMVMTEAYEDQNEELVKRMTPILLRELENNKIRLQSLFEEKE